MKTLTPVQQLALAVKVVADGHKDQVDKGGRPYILHVLQVMHYLETTDDELNAIAILHDASEDFGITFEELDRLGFSERVIDGVKRLTRIKGQKPKDYLRGLLLSEDACRVKICDLKHNTDIHRLKEIKEKDFTRLQKYHKMTLQIKSMLSWYEENNTSSYIYSIGDWSDYRDNFIEEVLSDHFSN